MIARTVTPEQIRTRGPFPGLRGRGEMMKTHGKIFVVMEGGLLQDVLTTSPTDLELVVIDHDTEGMEDDEFREYKKAVGELEGAEEAVSLMHGGDHHAG
jgi:hypothetical protein